MDWAGAVAVVTTNCPFARIYNDFPSAAALRGAGTLADSSRFPPHTHTHLVCHMETHTGKKKINRGAKINKHTHAHTHTHTHTPRCQDGSQTLISFHFRFMSVERREATVPLSLSLSELVLWAQSNLTCVKVCEHRAGCVFMCVFRSVSAGTCKRLSGTRHVRGNSPPWAFNDMKRSWLNGRL